MIFLTSAPEEVKVAPEPGYLPGSSSLQLLVLSCMRFGEFLLLVALIAALVYIHYICPIQVIVRWPGEYFRLQFCWHIEWIAV